MHLREKLASLSSSNIVGELERLLANAHVNTGWMGRYVFVSGYEGSVSIDELARRYLDLAVYGGDVDPSLQEKFQNYTLWSRVKQLYVDSEKQLDATWFSKYILWANELRSYYSSSSSGLLVVMFNKCTRASLLTFAPEEFQTLWPNQEPVGKAFAQILGEEVVRWQASKEMVRQALKSLEQAEPFTY